MGWGGTEGKRPPHGGLCSRQNSSMTTAFSFSMSELTFLKEARESGYDVFVAPSDGSSGVLDQDEIARIGIGATVLIAALCLIFINIPGTNRDLLVGAGIPMITTAATIATGGKGKKK